MLFWLMACKNTEVVLQFNPDPLDFGEVAITPDMPDTGYAQLELSVINAGEEDVSLSLAPYDTTWFCIEGFPNAEEETPLSTLSPTSSYILKVGICGHEAGTFDSDVDLSIPILTDGDPASFKAAVKIHPILQSN